MRVRTTAMTIIETHSPGYRFKELLIARNTCIEYLILTLLLRLSWKSVASKNNGNKHTYSKRSLTYVRSLVTSPFLSVE